MPSYFLRALLLLAPRPNHPFNADGLHRLLTKLPLVTRDIFWSVFLFKQYEQGENSPVRTLIDWAWKERGEEILEESSLKLYGKALAWFFTTSHRFVRDQATKAMVNLFSQRLSLLEEIIREFINIDDPYVLERLMAVAFGCTSKSQNHEEIRSLAQNIYHWFFAQGNPPVDVLLRDYGRLIIEYALHRNIKLNIDKEKIRPPFKGEWPGFEIPSQEELEKNYRGLKD